MTRKSTGSVGPKRAASKPIVKKDVYVIFIYIQVIFSSFNIGRFASEVVISLIYAKCLPVLLYATEACHIRAQDKRALEFTETRSLMKFFRTTSAIVVQNCHKFFHLLPVGVYNTVADAEIFIAQAIAI